MKFIKRLFSLLLILGIAWLVYTQYRHIPFMDYQAVAGSIRADIDGWLTQQLGDEKSQTISTPNTTAEEMVDNPTRPATKVRLKVPANPFASLDRYVRATPESAETDIATLAAYLGQRANTDLEKARAIYIWLTDNIAYDDAGFNSGKYSSTTAEDVLQNRISVCSGYSELYLALGEELELNIHKVIGYAKGYGYQAGNSFAGTDHAWNAIEINGVWRIFDATWGANASKNVNGRLVSAKGFDEYWFNVDPYEAIFNHYPENAALSFIRPNIDLALYERMPYVFPRYFRIVGDGRQILQKVLNEELQAFPKVYSSKMYLKAIELPREQQLLANESYSFVLQVPEAEKVALIDADNKWTSLKDDAGEFSLSYQPTVPGTLRLMVKKQGSKSFEGILEYEVQGSLQ